MKTLYLDCSMGAAGDMLMAALLELHPEPENFIRKLNGLHIPGVAVRAETAVKCGISGTRVSVSVGGTEEGREDGHAPCHDHPHGHGRAHGGCARRHEHATEHIHTDRDGHGAESPGETERSHEHNDMRSISRIVGGLDVPQKVRDDILAVYGLVAEGESRAHGKPVEQIHFHEVGMMDAVADIAGVCLLMYELAPGRVLASPVCVGYGHVRCAHGILPVPAPATAHILRGVPVYAGTVEGELCTPTGAALLRHFVGDFVRMPVMTVSAAGYGMGKRDFEKVNCVRALLGETTDPCGEIVELSCTLDDMTPEAVAFAMERLFEAGSLDVTVSPVVMKKSRPGICLSCLCRVGERDAVVRAVFRHTTTLGIREYVCGRYVLDRSERIVSTEYGPVRVKRAEGRGTVREKAEYEDLAEIARKSGMSFSEAVKMVRDTGSSREIKHDEQ